MNANRIFRSLTALSAVVLLALPAAAHATPIVEVSATRARNHLATSTRTIYYAAKERQYERLDGANLRQSATRHATGNATLRYDMMKDKQMERILNSE